MKKIINDPASLTRELLQGYCHAYSDKVQLIPGTHTVLRKVPKEKGKVKMIIGNGSGHEPCTSGWVGQGMLDMDVVGDIFSAPSYEDMFEGIKHIDDGSPILMCVMNHAGDVLNANLCYELAKDAGIDVHYELFYDDIASAPMSRQEERRGMAGYLFYMKIVGAMAEQGRNIEDCRSMFRMVRTNTRTLAVAVSGGTNPLSGEALFTLADDEIEVGMGAHGEGGQKRIKLCSAKKLSRQMCRELLLDGPYQKGDQFLVFVNGVGATTMMELYIVYKELFEYLSEKGCTAVQGVVDNLLTTQESAGFSISLLKLEGEMEKYWRSPSDAPYFICR